MRRIFVALIAASLLVAVSSAAPAAATAGPPAGTYTFHGTAAYGDSGIATSAGGAIVHVVAGAWPSAGPVEYYRSVDGGQIFATPVALTPAGQTGYEPRIATGLDGLVVAAWTDPVATGKWAVAVARSADDGKTWGAPTTLAPGPVRRDSLTLTTDGGRRVAASWADQNTEEIVLRVSTDGGVTFGNAVSIGTSSSHSRPSLAYAGATLVAAWQAQDNSVVTRRNATGGSGAWTAQVKLGHGSSDSGASVSTRGSTVVVAYTIGAPGEWRAAVHVSSDRGAHWSRARNTPATGDVLEAGATLLPRASQIELYGACNTGTVDVVCVRRSIDNGLTWGPSSRLSAASGDSFLTGAARGTRSLVLYYSFAGGGTDPTLILRRL